MSETQLAKQNKTTTEKQLSPLYYFYSVGCGFCKKADPIIDELIVDGHDILKLDLAEKDNLDLNKELKEKFNVKCGTPWFINAETGHQICGFREKDILLKWVNGEDIPAPPRPKSPPPPPPQDFNNKKQVGEWKTEYGKWSKENSHLPNLPPADQMLDRIKTQQEMMKQRQTMGGGNPALEAKISIMEQKLDRLLRHLGVNTDNIRPIVPPVTSPVAQQPVLQQPRSVPAPPASKKPPTKKRDKKGSK